MNQTLTQIAQAVKARELEIWEAIEQLKKDAIHKWSQSSADQKAYCDALSDLKAIINPNQK